MNKIKALRKPFKVGFIVLILSVIVFAITGFLLVTDKKDIPIGIISSGVLFSSLNFLQGAAEISDNKKEGSIFSILIIILRFVFIITFLLISALMYYRWNMPYINIFCVIGVYTVGIISTVLIYLLDKE